MDFLRRVVGKPQDVARIGNDARIFPGLQHLPVFPDLVLPLLGRRQGVRIDVLKPDEDPAAAGARRLLDEVRKAIAKRVHLQDNLEVKALVLPQMDHAIENGLPVPVACEIVVRDEEPLDALRRIEADQLLDVVGGAEARFSALDIDDGAKGALKGTAATGVEAGGHARHLANHVGRQERQRGALQVR